MKTSLPRSVFTALTLALVASVVPELKADASAPVPAKPAVSALPIIGPAPAWKLTDLSGKEIGREALKGKVVVVTFWATWCPPCVHGIPGYIALQKKHGGKGLVIVGLSMDASGAEKVTLFAKKRGINYILALADNDLVDLFGGLEAIPTTFLIDREGNIRHKIMGSMESGEFEKLVTPLL